MNKLKLIKTALWLTALWLCVLTLLVVLTGCAHFASRTYEETTDPTGHPVYRTTHMYVTAFFDSGNTFAGAANSPASTQTNQWSAGTRLKGFQQEASGTNVVDLLQSAVGAAVSAAVKATAK